MPRFDFRCPACGVFEAYAGRDERELECACGIQASRLPFSGLPSIKGETVAKAIPDPQYRFDAEKRAHRAKGWDEDRAIRTMRSALVEDNQGNKNLDLRRIGG